MDDGHEPSQIWRLVETLCAANQTLFALWQEERNRRQCVEQEAQTLWMKNQTLEAEAGREKDLYYSEDFCPHCRRPSMEWDRKDHRCTICDFSHRDS
jgi:hypothetical protein